MKKTTISLLLICFVLLSILGCTNHETTSKENNKEITKNTLEKITIGYSALRISLPVFVAVENNYFSDEGLDVKLVRFDTAQPLMQALIAGTVDVAGYTALPITYNAMIRGEKELYFLTAMIEDSNHPVSYLLVNTNEPESTTIADLKGKTIGILPTVAYQKWIELILAKNGLSTHDVTIIPIAPALQPASLQSGQVDALFTNDPAATTAIQQGIARRIGTEALVPTYMGTDFVFGSFNVDKTFADNNPETLHKISRALDKAVNFVSEHPLEAKQAMKRYVHESQKDYVILYPNAKYTTTSKTDPEKFQQIADKYLELGIIPNTIEVRDLVVSS